MQGAFCLKRFAGYVVSLTLVHHNHQFRLKQPTGRRLRRLPAPAAWAGGRPFSTPVILPERSSEPNSPIFAAEVRPSSTQNLYDYFHPLSYSLLNRKGFPPLPARTAKACPRVRPRGVYRFLWIMGACATTKRGQQGTKTPASAGWE